MFLYIYIYGVVRDEIKDKLENKFISFSSKIKESNKTVKPNFYSILQK